MIGGIKTDIYARTLKNLYACGEVACSGAHGAKPISKQLIAGMPSILKKGC